jgi:TRAP-type C4-dicarboxylate transport system permease small subunit
VNKFSVKIQNFISIVVHVIVSLFFAVLLYYSFIFVIGVKGHIAPAMQISMQIPYSSIIVGSALMMLESLKTTFNLIKRNSHQKKIKVH